MFNALRAPRIHAPQVVLCAAGIVVVADILQLLGVPYFPACFLLNAAGAGIIFTCLFLVFWHQSGDHRRERLALIVAAVAFGGSLLMQVTSLWDLGPWNTFLNVRIMDGLAEGGLGITLAALISLVVSSNRRASELTRQAGTDSLTGLPNRAAFYRSFAGKWEESDRDGHPLSCVLLDLDFFKRINDTHGHAAGDEALRRVARVLRDHTPQGGLVCRHGGEEFCTVIPAVTAGEAAAWAERLRKSLKKIDLSIQDKSIPITGSFGVAEKLRDVANPSQLVALADEALLAAKQSGRDRVLQYATLSSTGDDLLTAAQRNDPLRSVTSADVMYPLIHCLSATDSIRSAAQFLLDFRIASAPVVDANGSIVGIISDKDIMTMKADLWTDSVSEIMSTNVISFDHREPAQSVLEFLSRVSIRRIVVTRGDRPIGVISRGGLVQWLLNRTMPAEVVTGSDHDRRERLLDTARSITERGKVILERLHDDQRQLVPVVISEATRLQELAVDLLAHCHGGRGPHS